MGIFGLKICHMYGTLPRTTEGRFLKEARQKLSA
jgi:hypothetical protein